MKSDPGRRVVLVVALAVIVAAAVASALIAASGGIRYGTDDDRAFPYILIPGPLFSLLGWIVFLVAFLWGRSSNRLGAHGGRTLLIAAIILPIAAQASAQLAFLASGNYHHYPDCPAEHLGPC